MEVTDNCNGVVSSIDTYINSNVVIRMTQATWGRKLSRGTKELNEDIKEAVKNEELKFDDKVDKLSKKI